MKKNIYLAVILFFLLFSTNSYSQELAHKDIDTELSEEQRTEIADSDKSIKKAKSAIKRAEGIEKKNSKHKKKKKKYEKKTWEAKKNRISAQDSYCKAYKKVGDVYSDFLTDAVFFLESDKTEATSLNKEALELIEDAKKSMGKYKKYQKKALKKQKLKKIQSAMTTIQEQLEKALEKQFKALNIYLAQNDKKKRDVEDDLAWDDAKSVDKISSYHEYLNNFPRGKSASKATERIRELERIEEERLANENKKVEEVATGNTQGWVFQVQVLASRHRLSKTQVMKKAPGVTQYDEARSGGWYKYRTGTFYTYREAAKYRDSLTNSPKAFIVIFDSTGKQLKMTEEMKN